MPGFGKNNAEALMERRLQEHRDSENTISEIVSNDDSNREITTPDSVVISQAMQKPASDFKPKPKGTPRGSRNDRAYSEGIMPAEHQKVYNGFKFALGEETEGEIVLQRVLDNIGMSRAAVLRIIPYLEKYEYIRYESRPKKHCVLVSILK